MGMNRGNLLSPHYSTEVTHGAPTMIVTSNVEKILLDVHPNVVVQIIVDKENDSYVLTHHRSRRQVLVPVVLAVEVAFWLLVHHVLLPWLLHLLLHQVVAQLVEDQVSSKMALFIDTGFSKKKNAMHNRATLDPLQQLQF